MGLSGDLDGGSDRSMACEIDFGRWNAAWIGVVNLLAGNWGCPVAGTAVLVVGRSAFSNRTRACSESACYQASSGILDSLE